MTDIPVMVFRRRTIAAFALLTSLVPQPRVVQALDGTYTFPQERAIVIDRHVPSGLRDVAANVMRAHDVRISIALRMDEQDAALGAEGYRLDISTNGVTIGAHSAAGLFYGLQTLDELLPYGTAAASMPAVSIVDSPAYAWRGMHLDVSRHFFSVPVVKRYIDVAAHFKLNVFHWHLTDDQGWRIAIRRYPRLTTVGSCRAGTMRDHDATDIDPHRYCGFYTQSEIRDVVAYAKARYITVVPEIEMPGHSDAAIAAYPWLSCSGEHIGVRETWGVSTHIYCPTPRTFAFLENVLAEVMELFPSSYIHTGGDEVPKEEWARSSDVRALMKREHLASYDAVQGYFDRRIEAYLRAHGRRMIGWDEILDGGVTRSAAIMAWQGTERGTAAIRKGHTTIMSPDGILYFDALQGDENDEPEAIGGLTTPQIVHAFTAPPGTFGVQANLWTEYIPTEQQLFYMLLPRMMALADIAWSGAGAGDWYAYSARSDAQFTWLTRHGYRFRIPNPAFALDSAAPLEFDNVSPSVRTISAAVGADRVNVTISDDVPDAVVHFTIDGSTPTKNAPIYSEPIALQLESETPRVLQAIAVLPDGRSSTLSVLELRLHKKTP